jgi:hypothetical protein
MKSFSVLILVSLFGVLGFSQPDLPDDYKLETTEDFQKYQPAAEAAMRWLLETPVSQGAAVNKQLNGFVLQWIKGNPKIEADPRLEMIGPMIKRGYQYGPEMMLIYQSAMAMAEIQNLPLTRGQKHLVGVQAMLDAYQLIKDEAPYPFLNKMEKRQKKGKLAYWVEQKVR